MPPKAKEGKEKALTESEAKKMVLEYLDRENRPFNEKLIFENLQLKDRVKPATYKKIIEDLISAGDITEKTVKKAKILFADQSKKPEVDKVGLQKMEGDIAQLRDEYENLQIRLRELEQERNQLKQQLTNEELEEELKKYTKENEELSARLEGFRSGTQKPITAEEKKKIENAYKSTKTAWKSRKRMFSEISSTFQENMDPKQFKKMRVDLGISTDEESKVHPDNDNTSKFLKSATGK